MIIIIMFSSSFLSFFFSLFLPNNHCKNILMRTVLVNPSYYILTHLVSPTLRVKKCKCMNENLVRQDVVNRATHLFSFRQLQTQSIWAMNRLGLLVPTLLYAKNNIPHREASWCKWAWCKVGLCHHILIYQGVHCCTKVCYLQVL